MIGERGALQREPCTTLSQPSERHSRQSVTSDEPKRPELLEGGVEGVQAAVLVPSPEEATLLHPVDELLAGHEPPLLALRLDERLLDREAPDEVSRELAEAARA